jgi:dTDP-4-dehydrorhamnose reductase
MVMQMTERKTIMILGCTGLLGSAVSKYFIENTNYNIICTYKSDNNFEKFIQTIKSEYHDDLYKTHPVIDKRFVRSEYFNPDFNQLSRLDIWKADFIINCIGIIKPYVMKNVEKAININSIFPRILANYYKNTKTKILSIQSDCVLNGLSGPYDENSPHDAHDEYGKTKSLGETLDVMNLRTSIIGEEVHSGVSLIEWIKSQKNKEVHGYMNHWWNGMTTKEFAKTCEKIIKLDLYKTGIYHIFSTSEKDNEITKYYLVKLINEKFKLNLTIKPHLTSIKCDRRLITIYDLCSQLNINSIEKQIEEM